MKTRILAPKPCAEERVVGEGVEGEGSKEAAQTSGKSKPPFGGKEEWKIEDADVPRCSTVCFARTK